NAKLELPRELDLPLVEVVPPYKEQIAALDQQVGVVFPRQSMKDDSGAAQLDPKSQVASLYGVSMLDAARQSMEANVCLALVHGPGAENDQALINIALGAAIDLYGDPALAAAQAARGGGQSPNTRIAAARPLPG